MDGFTLFGAGGCEIFALVFACVSFVCVVLILDKAK